MKIFASRTDKNKLESYIGKNVWIKVHDTLRDYRYYIKILQRDYYNNNIWCNCIGYLAVDSDDFMLAPHIDWIDKVNQVKMFDEKYIEIEQPVQVLTDTELKEIIRDKL